MNSTLKTVHVFTPMTLTPSICFQKTLSLKTCMALSKTQEVKVLKLIGTMCVALISLVNVRIEIGNRSSK